MSAYRITLRAILFPLLIGWCGAGMALGERCYFSQYTPTFQFGSPGGVVSLSQEHNQRISACLASPLNCY